MDKSSGDQIDQILNSLPEDFNKLKELIPNDPKLKVLEDEFNKAYVFQRITKFAQDKNLKSLALKRVEPSYYNYTLESRKNILGAPSIHYLCKSLIMENTAFQQEFESPYYQRYYCIVIQYTSEVNSEKIAKVMRDYQNANCEQKLGKRSFHFRLVPPTTSFELTGYDFNAVTPFCLKSELPMILSKRIADLTPRFFYMGGGDVDLKLRISTDEFLNKCGYNVYIADIVDDTNYE